MRGYRKGANRTQQNRIRRYHDEGKSVEEISRFVLVEPACVQRFVESYKGKPEAEDVPRETAEAPEEKATPQTDEEETTASTAEPVSEPAPVKKKRGRPKKVIEGE